MKNRIAIAASVLVVAILPSEVDAAFSLRVDPIFPLGPGVTIVDNGIGDRNPTAGIISFFDRGSLLPQYSLFDVLAKNRGNVIRLSGPVQVTANQESVIRIAATDSDVHFSSAYQLVANIEDIVDYGESFSLYSFDGAENGSSFVSISSTTVPFSGSATRTTSGIATGNLSLSAVLVSTAAGQRARFNTSLLPVPAPASLPLFVGALASIGLIAQRRKKHPVPTSV